MWISGPTEGLENIFLLLQSTSNPDKRVYGDRSSLTYMNSHPYMCDYIFSHLPLPVTQLWILSKYKRELVDSNQK